MRKRNAVTVTAASLVLLVGTLITLITGAPHPLADQSDNLGQSLLPFGQTIASGWTLLTAAMLLLAGAAQAFPSITTLHRRRRSLSIVAAVAGLLTIDHTLLMAFGYVPFIISKMLAGEFELLEVVASPGLAMQAAIAAAATALLLGLRSKADRDPVAVDPDELDAATARTRRWAHIAMEAPVVYALTRLLMFFDVPGFDGFPWDVRIAGMGLAAGAVGGAVLTWGLIRPWGERFPRWMVGLAGRRVPIDLAVLPAMFVAALVLAASRSILLTAITDGVEGLREQLEYPLVALPQLLWPLWGVALGLAALAYQRRRRLAEAMAQGQAQGQGRVLDQPEQEPAEV